MTQEDERARSLVHGQVCYLQIPAVDADRAAAFYEAVFGWQTEHPYQDFISPGLIGQWVTDRPPASDKGPMIWIHRHRTAPTAPWPRSPTRKATPSTWPATTRHAS
jgi:hypothetical protein